MKKKFMLVSLITFLFSSAYGMEPTHIADFNPEDYILPLAFVKQQAHQLISPDSFECVYQHKGVSYIKCYHRIESVEKVEGNSLTVENINYPLSPKHQYPLCFYETFAIKNPEDHTKHIVALGILISFMENRLDK